MSPGDKTLFFESPGWTSYKSYISVDEKRVSKWVSLIKDDFYYLEVHHIQYTGGDHLTVSVEIEDPLAVPGHHHTMREI